MGPLWLVGSAIDGAREETYRAEVDEVMTIFGLKGNLSAEPASTFRERVVMRA